MSTSNPGSQRRRPARPAQLLLTGALGLTMLLTGCAAATTPSHSTAPSHAVVTFADQPGAAPNYIFPFAPGADTTFANGEFGRNLMYMPLYWFMAGIKVQIDYSQSLALPPVYSNGGRTVTIRLKHYRWSDGRPVTSRDVIFFLNMMRYEKANWGQYAPGDMPDNIVSYSAPNPSTVVITFNQDYNKTWLLYSQLSDLIPMPQAVWDRTSFAGPVGNYDYTATGTEAVYKFLNAESSNLATYTSNNPLWSVVDGPFRLSHYSAATGEAILTANPLYSGIPKPQIAELVEVPFTSATAEFDALRSGSLDYGYIPPQYLAQESYFKARGYKVAPWLSWGINFQAYNFGNPKVAAIFDQLYFRQAMQHLVNQPAYIASIFHGTAVPTYGPAPVEPPNPWLSSAEKSNPYPYDPSKATTLLTSHGWHETAGVMECRRPGVGGSECGAGIAAGTKLAFTIEYPAGDVQTTEMEEAFESSASLAGIQITLKQVPENAAFADLAPCSGSGCTWEMGFPSSPAIVYAPAFSPTGRLIFGTGGAFNFGSYSNETNDQNIAATHEERGLAPYYQYEKFLSLNLPVNWLPAPDYQVSVMKDTLHGAASNQNAADGIDPWLWSVS